MKNTCYKTVLKASYACKIPMSFYNIMLALKTHALKHTNTQKNPQTQTLRI